MNAWMQQSCIQEMHSRFDKTDMKIVNIYCRFYSLGEISSFNTFDVNFPYPL